MSAHHFLLEKERAQQGTLKGFQVVVTCVLCGEEDVMYSWGEVPVPYICPACRRLWKKLKAQEEKKARQRQRTKKGGYGRGPQGRR